MKTIGGISLEKYAELCAKMNDVLRDTEACIKIAEEEGYKRENWEKAHEGWQERITDPADMGKTASRFDPFWRGEIARLKDPAEKNTGANSETIPKNRGNSRK